LAVFFAVAVARTEAMALGGEHSAEALVAGYRWAFFVGAGIAALGAAAALRLVGRDARHEVDSSGEPSHGKC
jgi:hypothetical protein